MHAETKSATNMNNYSFANPTTVLFCISISDLFLEFFVSQTSINNDSSYRPQDLTVRTQQRTAKYLQAK